MSKGFKILVTVFVIIMVISLVSNYFQFRFGRLEKVENFEVDKDADFIKIDNEKIVESSIILDDQNKKIEVITKVVERVPEGYVKLDLTEYRKNMRAFITLKKRYSDMQNHRIVDSNITIGESEVVKDSIKVEFDSDILKFFDEIDTMATISLKYQTSGFIFRPSWGIGYCDGLDFTVGLKTFFYNKYNVGLYATTNLGGIGIGRHLNDIVKVFKNTELRAITGMGYKGGFRFWIGLTTDM